MPHPSASLRFSALRKPMPNALRKPITNYPI
jgi:hypothetical protein